MSSVVRRRPIARTLVVLVALALPCVPALPADAQSPAPAFGVEDALDVVHERFGALSRDGRWLATVADSRRDALGVDFRRDGDPSYVRPTRSRIHVINTEDGTQRSVLPESRTVRALAWSPDADRLAFLLYDDGQYAPTIWNRSNGRVTTVRPDPQRPIAENTELTWTRDGQSLVFGVRSSDWARNVHATFERYTAGPVFVQSSEQPFLAWEALRRMRDRYAVVAMHVASGRVRELLPDGQYDSWRLVANDSAIVWSEDVTPRTDYDEIFGTKNRLRVRALDDTVRRMLLPSLDRTTVDWSTDGRRYAWSREGRVFLAALGDSAGTQIAGLPTRDTTATDTSEAARARRAAERFALSRISPTGDAVLISNRDGFWLYDTATRLRTLIATRQDSVPSAPRVRAAAWSGDSGSIYFYVNSRTEWERGIMRWNRSAAQLDTLLLDERLLSGLRAADTGDRLLLQRASGNRPLDWYATDAALSRTTRLTDANPWLAERALGTTSLVTYRDGDGVSRYGVVLRPPNARDGEPLPTVFIVYEDFFDNTFDATANVLAGRGYMVVKPSVGFETGYPGEAWIKGVTAAANALIERGMADSTRLGVQGTSYGGYAVNLLVTQTPRFRAAVNVSGKVDMISFYTDSPRLGVRNIHAAEKSQDRLGATLWEQPQKYVAQSAIMFADRITTPLLLLTGAQDHNVPADNTREMYYALRRLGKTVTWANYMNGGHGAPRTTSADYRDYHERIVDWYDTYLRAPVPGTPAVAAISLRGARLVPTPPAPAARARMEQQLRDARNAWLQTPDNADSLIWFGRRTAYLGRYRAATRIFGDGLAAHPDDARLLRHRGHRWITLRMLDSAVADLSRAAALVQGRADVVEPDGQPNARNIPTSTLQTNIYYHLGLARYLRGEFDDAVAAWQACLDRSHNNDMRIATTYWLYLGLRQGGREGEADQLLATIQPGMEVIENGSYYRLLLMYKGMLHSDSLVAPSERGDGTATGGSLGDVTTGYGLAAFHLLEGRTEAGRSTLRRVLAQSAQWPAFGYVAAEAELTRLESSDPTRATPVGTSGAAATRPATDATPMRVP